MFSGKLDASVEIAGRKTIISAAVFDIPETEATREWSREKESLSWAMTLANLGVASRKLAEHNRGIAIPKRVSADLKKAVDVFRDTGHVQLTELGEEQLSFSRKLNHSNNRGK
jgi:hypothetical protein